MLRFAFVTIAVLSGFGRVVFGADPINTRTDTRPNVIVILTDDQGTLDAGCYGATDLQTPSIDRLAKRGVRFTQFYAAAPVCSPSRAGLLTGRYPILAGMPGNAGGPPNEGVNELSDMETPKSVWAKQTTMAEMFHAAGYATAHIGKWHLNIRNGERPLDQGFDYSFGHMGGCIDNFTHFFYWSGPNRHDLWRNNERIREPGQFFPDMMVTEASEFISTNREKPFFIYFAMNTPHYPYQGEPEWLETYKEVPYPRNLYNAFVSTLDSRIGRLLDHVDKLGLTNDTIIVFQSDHGHSTESRAHNGGGNAGPYRGAKFSLFEGGIRVPAIISWPGHLPEGEVRNQLAHSCDWLPTVAELCDVRTPQNIDGQSLVPVVVSAEVSTPHDTLHWTFGNSWAVRHGDWKLIANPRDTSNRGPLGKEDKLFLSNVNQDKSEMENLARKNPNTVKELKALHDAWSQTKK
ncbi:sulfatase-like hydrolase/transferase [Thalassoroseus pseudoceratinae]|uniref:sulfatase-like hydrolase/transferase n=1 Tax=Thalassoroseus pseudoceratinae TaxID=2713176 RepID=UPI001420957F|nr:sulfatase-like hydrolase/transferase [Thalassoroseus pseudoceratinae]